VLNGVLALHDINDVEAYCAHILNKARLTLTPQDHEDALAYLITAAWHLSTTYKPGTRSFSGYAGKHLPRRLIDWQRQRKDTRYPSNTKYTTVSIDEPAGHIGLPTYNHTSRNDGIRDRLAQADLAASHDNPRDRNADQLVRLLRKRSRQPTRNNNTRDPRTTPDTPRLPD
jgi:hypothetical protein